MCDLSIRMIISFIKQIEIWDWDQSNSRVKFEYPLHNNSRKQYEPKSDFQGSLVRVHISLLATKKSSL